MTENTKVVNEVEEREGDNDTCLLCCKDVDIYSIGDCDHPVCHECSTRLRVLCEQNECPICRRVLSKVIFTYDKLPYRELEAKNRSRYYSKKYKIGFYCAKIQQAFFDLLDHPCPKCDVPPFRKFNDLKNHVRVEHDLHYCDLCTENLKIFTFERRCYTQAELGLHRTKGDRDNRSHRGHPLCEFCKKRYLDRDELFRHLRRDHFFCHFCDADGSNEFYGNYDALANHFREDHFLCEEGKCATEHFIGAFRTEIDYKAHIANVHANSLNKHQAKQTRTLQVEITLGRHGRANQADGNVGNARSRGTDERYNDSIQASVSHAPQQRSITIDRCNEEDFPLLGGSNSGPSVSLACPPPPYMHIRSGTAGLARTKENFPALGAGGGGGFNDNGHKGQQAPISTVLRKAPAVSIGAPARSHPTSAGNGSSGMVIHVSNRPTTNATNGAIPKKNTNDFPALPTGKAKKSGRLIDEDMLPSNAHIPMTNVAAKHRTLVDDYVSVANPNNIQKIQMVQKEEQEAKSRKAIERTHAPKLTSQDFPTLGEGSNKPTVQPNSWVKSQSEKKQRELENRKSKIAPAPILPKDKANNNNTTTNKKQSATKIQTGQEQLSKKDKKTKEKRPTVENPSQQNKFNGKVKEKNNQNNQRINDENKLVNNVPINLVNGNDDAQAMRPPPGFDNSSAYVQPPPGFHSNVTVNSIAKSPNNLTFTSSLGESYSIIPVHSYVAPQNAVMRNQKLVSHFKNALQTPEALEEFRHISQKFREGLYKAMPYYEHCQAALKNKFDEIFPELLALLPDISKQQALYLVHTQRLIELPANQRKSLPKLNVCAACKQVLMPDDLDNHVKEHELTDQFPLLGSSTNSSNSKNPTAIRK